MNICLFLLFACVLSTPQVSSIGRSLSSLAVEINMNPKSTWRASVQHRFLSATEEDLERLGGTQLTQEQVKRMKASLEEIEEWTQKRGETLVGETAAAPPDTFDSRLAWPGCLPIGYVYDQANCASDYAIAPVTTMQDRLCIINNQQYIVELSFEDLLECCSNCGQGCPGGSVSNAWDYLNDNGVVTGGGYMNEDWCKPYFFAPCSHTGKSGIYPPCGPTALTPRCYYACPNRYYSIQYGSDHHFVNYADTINPNMITTELSTNGPVQAVMTLFQDFLTYQSGVYKHTTGTQIGTLSVKIIGYGTENGTPYWLCTNSWNETWGAQGFFKIARGTNECGIEANVVAPKVNPQARKGSPFKSVKQQS